MAEHFQTGGQPYRGPRGIYVPSIFCEDFVPDGVVLRTPGFSIGPLDTFALWSRGNVDPLVHRVLSLLKEIKKELQPASRLIGVSRRALRAAQRRA
jgi:hypothetical protein